MKVLIVKTSALGDILQSFSVISAIRSIDPEAMIDFVVEDRFLDVVKSHPLVNRSIALSLKNFKSKFSIHFFRNIFSFIKTLRKESYDLCIDLQGNCKSALVVCFAKARHKLGFGFKTAREWPAALFLTDRVDFQVNKNISKQLLKVLEFFLKRHLALSYEIDLQGSLKAYSWAQNLLDENPFKFLFVIAPFAKWENKMLKASVWEDLLKQISLHSSSQFVLIHGNASERRFCEQLAAKNDRCFVLPEVLPIADLQKFIAKADLFIGVDSSALHLTALTKTPSFSVFGPTSIHVFKPEKDNHFGLMGTCPYHVTFEKLCPFIRKCHTGACIKDISSTLLFQKLQQSFPVFF